VVFGMADDEQRMAMTCGASTTTTPAVMRCDAGSSLSFGKVTRERAMRSIHVSASLHWVLTNWSLLEVINAPNVRGGPRPRCRLPGSLMEKRLIYQPELVVLFVVVVVVVVVVVQGDVSDVLWHSQPFSLTKTTVATLSSIFSLLHVPPHTSFRDHDMRRKKRGQRANN
jgi:hypothetical protein